jgi:hypothetical protein
MVRKTAARLAVAAAIVLAAAVPLLGQAGSAAAAETLTVNLASSTGTSTSVGAGVLYGVSQDGTQPADQYLLPLGLNSYRGGGHASSGWIGDGYTYGTGTKADVTEIIAQAKRLEQAPYHVTGYQVILSDVYGADGSQPSTTTWPCASGNCANWETFIDDVVGALNASGLSFSYDIWNEPDQSIFWSPGMNSAQYFEMWNAGYNEIKKDAPSATTIGPSLSATPGQNSGEWSTWLSTVKADGTVPDEISNHLEGDGDDPVSVGSAVNSDLSANGISAKPLSANEYQPSDQQSAGQTAWYLDRLAQSGYRNAMRGNWVCCETPNLTGLLTQSGSTWLPTGNWWVMRSYADMTGSRVSTSGEVGTTAITATEDSAMQRAVALVGDENGYTGSASVTFSGFSSVSWLTSGGSVNVVVERIPDSSPLTAPTVVLSESVSTSSGSISVPFTFQSSHDAFAVYLTPTATVMPGYHKLVIGNDSLCLDVYGNVTTAGAAIDQWTCNGQGNQEFRFVPVSGGYGELQAGNSGDDVAVANSSTTAGTADIIQQTPNGNTASLWLPVRQSDGSYEFKNENSGLCLDVTKAVSTLGQQLDQWACKNAAGNNQDFTAS